MNQQRSVIASCATILAVLCLTAWQPAAAQDVESPALVAAPLGATQDSGEATRAQAIQCFWDDGVYGQITVTTSGAGCGTSLPFGGITGLWLGDTNISESCTYTISPAVPGTSGTVAMTAHSCIDGSCERTRFRLNGVDYNVVESDVDQTEPPGGSPLVVLASGEVEGSPEAGGDGRGTITFNSAPPTVTTIEIDHIVTIGSPNGTIYLICFDDVPVELMQFDIE